MASETQERSVEAPQRMIWTRDRDYQVADAGVLGEDEMIALIGGEILIEGLDLMTQRVLSKSAKVRS